MLLNKNLYREMYQQYQAVQQGEIRQRLRNRQQIAGIEAWRQYLDLVEFCRLLCPSQSQRHRAEKLAMFQEYYERMRQFEAWRQTHGKTT